MAVDLRGTFLCTQSFARARKEFKGGAIANITSDGLFSAPRRRVSLQRLEGGCDVHKVLGAGARAARYPR